jgi:hypothetical protein
MKQFASFSVENHLDIEIALPNGILVDEGLFNVVQTRRWSVRLKTSLS